MSEKEELSDGNTSEDDASSFDERLIEDAKSCITGGTTLTSSTVVEGLELASEINSVFNDDSISVQKKMGKLKVITNNKLMDSLILVGDPNLVGASFFANAFSTRIILPFVDVSVNGARLLGRSSHDGPLRELNPVRLEGISSFSMFARVTIQSSAKDELADGASVDDYIASLTKLLYTSKKAKLEIARLLEDYSVDVYTASTSDDPFYKIDALSVVSDPSVDAAVLVQNNTAVPSDVSSSTRSAELFPVDTSANMVESALVNANFSKVPGTGYLGYLPANIHDVKHTDVFVVKFFDARAAGLGSAVYIPTTTLNALRRSGAGALIGNSEKTDTHVSHLGLLALLPFTEESNKELSALKDKTTSSDAMFSSGGFEAGSSLLDEVISNGGKFSRCDITEGTVFSLIRFGVPFLHTLVLETSGSVLRLSIIVDVLKDKVYNLSSLVRTRISEWIFVELDEAVRVGILTAAAIVTKSTCTELVSDSYVPLQYEHVVNNMIAEFIRNESSTVKRALDSSKTENDHSNKRTKKIKKESVEDSRARPRPKLRIKDLRVELKPFLDDHLKKMGSNKFVNGCFRQLNGSPGLSQSCYSFFLTGSCALGDRCSFKSSHAAPNSAALSDFGKVMKDVFVKDTVD